MNAAANENVLTVERVVNAPRALVWQAWTDPMHARQWWGPDGCTVPVFESDLRPGGHFRIDLDFGGVIGRIEGIYEEIVELERLVTVASLAQNGVKVRDSRRIVTFEDDGAKTKNTLQQTFYNVAPEGEVAIAGAKEGMKQQYDRLEAHLNRQRSA